MQSITTSELADLVRADRAAACAAALIDCTVGLRCYRLGSTWYLVEDMSDESECDGDCEWPVVATGAIDPSGRYTAH